MIVEKHFQKHEPDMEQGDQSDQDFYEHAISFTSPSIVNFASVAH